jgi:hypothetical protein
MPTTRHLERLNDPRWHAFRIRLLSKRGRFCEGCGAAGSVGAPLHLHHAFYEGDRYPWDYPDDSLHVFCATCHGKAQALMSEMNRVLGRLSLEEYVTLRDLEIVRPLVRAALVELAEKAALEYVRSVTGQGRGTLTVAR